MFATHIRQVLVIWCNENGALLFEKERKHDINKQKTFQLQSSHGKSYLLMQSKIQFQSPAFPKYWIRPQQTMDLWRAYGKPFGSRKSRTFRTTAGPFQYDSGAVCKQNNNENAWVLTHLPHRTFASPFAPKFVIWRHYVSSHDDMTSYSDVSHHHIVGHITQMGLDICP